MKKRVAARIQSTKTLTLIGIISVAGFLQACAAHAPPLPVSHWGDNYYYGYEPPRAVPPVSVKATIVIINPTYRDTENVLADSAYNKVGRGFSKSMGVDLDKVIIAKGMTTIGPYLTLDDVTYPDKKNADLTLAPRVFLTAQTTYGEWQRVSRATARMQRNFKMKIGGWVSYVMQEPLSGEKIWVKKLELEEKEISGIEVRNGPYPTRDTTAVGGAAGAIGFAREGKTIQANEMLYDGKADAIADALKAFYPTIMGKAWTYIDTTEILSLREKTKEIRGLKRY